MTPPVGEHGPVRDAAVTLYSRLPITADAAWWADLAAQAPGGRVLYVGCGAGRLLPVLARRCREVVAVDLDPAMLQAAAGRLADHRDLDARVWLVAGKAETMPVDGRFGLVLLPSGLLNELPGRAAQEAALTAAADRCRRDGRVAIQVLNPYFLATADRWEGTIEPAGSGRPVRVQGRVLEYDPWTQMHRAQLAYRFADGTVLEHTMEADALFPREVKALAAGAGLAIVGRWGGRPGVDPPGQSATSWHLLCAPQS